MSIAACIDKLVKLRENISETGERAKIMEGVATRTPVRPHGLDRRCGNGCAGSRKDHGRICSARRFQVAKQAIAQAGALDRVMTHKHSKAAGAMALMSSDIRGAAKGELTSIRIPSGRGRTGQTDGQCARKIRAWHGRQAQGAGRRNDRRSRIGLVDNTAERNVIRELRRVNTGDADARELATAFKQSGELSVKRAKASGYIFNERTIGLRRNSGPANARASMAREAFMRDVLREYDSGALKIVNDDGIEFKEPGRSGGVLRKSWKDIAGRSDRKPGMGRSGHIAGGSTSRWTKAGAESWIGCRKNTAVGATLFRC